MNRGRRLRALGWVGGKSAHASQGTGKWIAGLLPPPSATYTYIEPFAGMLGVLLQRDAARREIVNDLDDDLINWWTIVRDEPVKLGDMLDFTPGWSSALFGEACSNLDHPDPIRRAYYFTCAVHWVRGNMIGRVRQAIDAKDEDDGITRSDTARQDRWDKVEANKRPDDEIFDLADGNIKRMPEARTDKWGSRESRQYREAKERADVAMRRTDSVRDERGDGISGSKAARTKTDDASIMRMPVSFNEKWGNRETEQYREAQERADKAATRRSSGKQDGKQRDDDGIRRAAVTRHQTDQDGKFVGRPDFGTGTNKRLKGGEMSPPRSPHILALAERIRDVELETRDAAWMLDYYAANPNITFYLDPPYPSAAKKSSLYTFNDLDVDNFVSLLAELQGLAAVSGYGTEWVALEDLGWMRHEHRTFMSAGAQHDRARPERVEVLWTNYDPADYEPEPGLFG